MQTPEFRVEIQPDAHRVVLSGDWTLAAMIATGTQDGRGDAFENLQKKLRGAADAAAPGVPTAWDLRDLHRLDSAGALLIWRVWDGARPGVLALDAEAERAFERVASVAPLPLPERSWQREMLELVGRRAISAWEIVLGMISLLGQLLIDTLHVLRHPREMPVREFSAALYKAGVTALPITGMLGFLVGMVMSYLMAMQLRNFGADRFIIDVLGYGILREFGPVMMAVLVAGRSGSAMTAQLGLMRVTEEIDALATMGISRHLRLVFPKVVALSLAGPLLMLWTSLAAIAGGMLSAYTELDIAPAHFFSALPSVVPFGTLLIGLFKGGVFCALIAVIACYFGLSVRPNTESLSARTTLSVVVSITAVILADAVIALMTRGIGVPYG